MVMENHGIFLYNFNMNNLKEYISEKLKINKNTEVNKFNYHPKDRYELISLIKELIKERGLEADLNDIDVSNITRMNAVFYKSEFNGNISKWDVSNVTNMREMFYDSKFNQDISSWDVSKVENMDWMFYGSDFNGNISSWDVSNVTDMNFMFNNSPLQNNPPHWYHE